MIVEAAFVMVGDPTVAIKSPHVQAIEDAMLAALKQAQAEGLDPEATRARVIAARDNLLGASWL